MNDFACTAMIRLLTRGIDRLGMPPPATRAPRGSTVELSVKRALVTHVLSMRGPAALVQLGQAVHDLDTDPILLMLTRVRSPHQVLTRFQRLERFVHSRHRVLVERHANNSLHLRHISLVAEEPPLPAENLVVLGVLIGFLQAAGCKGVTAQFSAHKDEAFPDGTAINEAFLDERTDRWEIRWKSFKPTEADSIQGPDLGMDTSPPIVRKVAHFCATDTDMTLISAAARLGMSKRTLQRRLREADCDFRTISGDIRNRIAAWWLAQTDHSIAEVGFLCGYSDQAHFTRDFKQRNGPTPNAYRGR